MRKEKDSLSLQVISKQPGCSLVERKYPHLRADRWMFRESSSVFLCPHDFGTLDTPVSFSAARLTAGRSSTAFQDVAAWHKWSLLKPLEDWVVISNAWCKSEMKFARPHSWVVPRAFWASLWFYASAQALIATTTPREERRRSAY